MDNLQQFKTELKYSLPQKGITYVLKALREALPDTSRAYNLLIQLESEYREHKIQVIEGILDNDEIQKAVNLIRKRLLDLIDDLEESDFNTETPSSLHESDQRVRRGHVLYQVPKTMQLGEESRCLVRIAFDKAMLMEDLDLDVDTEVRSNVRISDYMKVEIVDPAESPVFAIRPQSEAVQFIDKDDFTEWRFYVKPLQPGKHTLELKVTIIMVINGREVPRERTLEESVVIITEPVEGSVTAFRQLEDTFEMGGTMESDLLPVLDPEVVMPPPPPQSPRSGGGIEQKKEVLVDIQPSAIPSRKKSGVRLPRVARSAAFALLALIVASTATYAFVPPAEIAWVTTRYLKNTPEAYDSFIVEYGENSPLRREQAYFRRAVVLEKVDAYRTYLAEYEQGRFTEQATWQVARLSDEPLAYDRYIQAFPQGTQLAEARQALLRLEPKVWETISQGKDVAAIDRYLDLYPNGRFRDEAILRKQEWQDRLNVQTEEIAGPERIQLSDDEVWENIRERSKAEDLRKYLELFPEGKYVGEARRRLSVLDRGLKLDLNRSRVIDTLRKDGN